MSDDARTSILKAAAAWLGVGLSKLGVHSWSDFAAICAALYSLCLIYEWASKRWRKRRGF